MIWLGGGLVAVLAVALIVDARHPGRPDPTDRVWAYPPVGWAPALLPPAVPPPTLPAPIRLPADPADAEWARVVPVPTVPFHPGEN